MKQFVRALDKGSPAFNYLQDFFPKLSAAKVEAGVYIGPQIKKGHGVQGVSQKTDKDGESSMGQLCRSGSWLLGK